MRNSIASAKIRSVNIGPLAVSFILAGFLAGCSTDVQRFGHTGSLGSTAAEIAAPVVEVERALLGVAGLAEEPAGVNEGSAYMGASLAEASVTPGAGRLVEVEPGDTAFSIARRNGVSVAVLVEANDLSAPYAILIGQKIIIPGEELARTPVSAPKSVPARGGTAHTVSTGDTLFNISQRYGIDVKNLSETNNLDVSGTIRIGQILRLPGDRTQSATGGPLNRVLKSRVVEESEAVSKRQVAALTPPVEALATPVEITQSKFRWPAKGRVVSPYGEADNGQQNDGINISVPEGTSVKAAEGGVVAYAGSELKRYGNLVLIKHDNDFVTAYAHNSALLVTRGDNVMRGQVIAKAGQSGSVKKPQIHFEVRQGSKAVDPMPFLEGA